MQHPILSIPQLDVTFSSDQGEQRVLNHFQLSLHHGRCMGLVGESGSGKTLSALSILQLLPMNAFVSTDSQIIFHSHNLLDFSEKKMRTVRGKHIGMIFQDAMSAFNPVLTIGQQLRETIRLHLSLNRRDSKARALHLLEEVGIREVSRCYEAYPHELSGGMRQRAMIAMAISTEPEIIIADEPTTALDMTLQAQVLDLLDRLKKKNQCALLFIAHDLSVVSKMADDVTVLKSGHIVEQNEAKLFFQHPTNTYSKQLFAAILTNTPRQEIQTTDNTSPLLTVDNLICTFKREITAVNNVSFSIQPGETLALVGESGSGKTTTAKAILQLLKNTRGQIVFEGKTLSQLSSQQLRMLRKDMQIIFQDPTSALNPRMMIIDSLSEGLMIQKKVRHKKEALPIIDAILNEVELPAEFKWRYPHEVSGGQRQRICIARALTLSPKLFILDEPTSALDVSTQKQILSLLERLQKEKKLSYLLITHNLSVVAYLAHRVVVMHQGKIVEYGNVNDIMQTPQHAYTKLLLRSVITDNG